MRFLHTMVRVKDLEASLDFYVSKLGMIEISKQNYPQGRFTLVYLAAPQDKDRADAENAPLLELTYNWEAENYTKGRNFGHIAFEVGNIYDFCKDLMDKGVEINRPPRDGRMAFVKSPDDISIEFLQKGQPLPVRYPWEDMPNKGEW